MVYYDNERTQGWLYDDDIFERLEIWGSKRSKLQASG